MKAKTMKSHFSVIGSELSATFQDLVKVTANTAKHAAVDLVDAVDTMTADTRQVLGAIADDATAMGNEIKTATVTKATQAGDVANFVKDTIVTTAGNKMLCASGILSKAGTLVKGFASTTAVETPAATITVICEETKAPKAKKPKKNAKTITLITKK